jgi:hypothetical protein
MQTMNLQIEESFFPHFKALVDSFINDNKIRLIGDDFPKELIVNNEEEVRIRVLEAEKRIKNGNFLTENKFWETVDNQMERR